MMATEKVTRKTLTDADHKRLVEDALSELDFSALSGGELAPRWADPIPGLVGTPMEEIAEVYARSLFEVAEGRTARTRSTTSSGSSPTR